MFNGFALRSNKNTFLKILALYRDSRVILLPTYSPANVQSRTVQSSDDVINMFGSSTTVIQLTFSTWARHRLSTKTNYIELHKHAEDNMAILHRITPYNNVTWRQCWIRRERERDGYQSRARDVFVFFRKLVSESVDWVRQFLKCCSLQFSIHHQFSKDPIIDYCWVCDRCRITVSHLTIMLYKHICVTTYII